jgi:hypothetical protein
MLSKPGQPRVDMKYKDTILLKNPEIFLKNQAIFCTFTLWHIPSAA